MGTPMQVCFDMVAHEDPSKENLTFHSQKLVQKVISGKDIFAAVNIYICQLSTGV